MSDHDKVSLTYRCRNCGRIFKGDTMQRHEAASICMMLDKDGSRFLYATHACVPRSSERMGLGRLVGYQKSKRGRGQ